MWISGLAGLAPLFDGAGEGRQGAQGLDCSHVKLLNTDLSV